MMKCWIMIFAIFLAACNSGGSNGSTQALNSGNNTQLQGLSIESVARVLVSDQDSLDAVVILHNNTNESVYNITYQVNNQAATTNNNIIIDNPAACRTLKPNMACTLVIKAHAVANASYPDPITVTAQLESKTLSQVVTFKNLLTLDANAAALPVGNRLVSIANENEQMYTAYIASNNTLNVLNATTGTPVGQPIPVGAGSSIALTFNQDGDGFDVYVAYANSQNVTNGRYPITVESCAAGTNSWVSMGTVGTGGGANSNAAYPIALVNPAMENPGTNIAGIPVLIYTNVASYNKANALGFIDGSWTPVGNPNFTPGTALAISGTTDTSGNVHIGFADGKAGYAASVMSNTGGNWFYPAESGFSATTISSNSITTDNSGNLYLGYVDYGNNSKATVMTAPSNGSGTNTWGSWVLFGPEAFSPGPIYYPSMTTDPAGNVYIAYIDGSNNKNNGIIVEMYPYEGMTWSYLAPNNFTGPNIGSPSISMYSDGTTTIQYVFYTNAANAYMSESYNGVTWN